MVYFYASLIVIHSKVLLIVIPLKNKSITISGTFECITTKDALKYSAFIAVQFKVDSWSLLIKNWKGCSVVLSDFVAYIVTEYHWSIALLLENFIESTSFCPDSFKNMCRYFHYIFNSEWARIVCKISAKKNLSLMFVRYQILTYGTILQFLAHYAVWSCWSYYVCILNNVFRLQTSVSKFAGLVL